MPYRYERLTLEEDINTCTQLPDPTDMVNCIRTKMGYPPISPIPTPPRIDSNTISCIKVIMDRYQGYVDTDGTMLLEVEIINAMINDVLACMGMGSLDLTIPSVYNCNINCKTEPSNINRTNCMVNCMPKIQLNPMPPEVSTCVYNCNSKTTLHERLNCISSCFPVQP